MTGTDRRYANATCPYCQVAIQPLPASTTDCPACRRSIVVRLGPDGLRYLLQEGDVRVLDQAWAESQQTHGVRGIALRIRDEATRSRTGFGGWRLWLSVLVISLAAGAMVPVGMAILSGVPIAGTTVATPVRPSPTASRPAGGSVATATPAPEGPTPEPATLPAPSPDRQAPVVIDRNPAPDAVGVAVGSSIEIRFSEPVKGVSVTTVRLRNLARGWVVRSRVRYDVTSHTATLTPARDMYPRTSYRVVISSGITDRFGNALAPVRWSFRTASR